MDCQSAQDDTRNDRLKVIVVRGGDGSEERPVYSHSSSPPLKSVGGIGGWEQTQQHYKPVKYCYIYILQPHTAHNTKTPY